MSKKFTLLKIPIIIFAFIFISACSGEQGQNGENEESETSGIETESDNVFNKNITYRLPSPVELYIFLDDNEAVFQEDAINSSDNVSKYFTNQSKTINFGIYASDLAYSTVFGQHQQTFSYFKIVRELADQLGYAEGFNMAIVSRMENNQYNLDSLYQIANDAYWDACIYLEEQEQHDALALIYTGGWIESLYISIKSVKQFNPDDPIIIRIAEQQILLDNLIGTYYTIDEELQPKELLNKLIYLQSIYDKLYDNTDVIITEEQYNEIASEVESLRNEFTG
ncbi:MAG: hypothetical protein KAT68_00335 [Bacteroidales bacterium]|nr:hypothetical protein [Bacteroidales bacterium]